MTSKMVLMAGAATLTGVATASSNRAGAFGGSEYLLVLEQKETFEVAAANCQTMLGDGGTLATIDSTAENDYIFSLAPVIGTTRWIGLSRTDDSYVKPSGDTNFENADWKWLSGKLYNPDTTHWFQSPDEPNNNKGKERCVVQGSSNTNAGPPGGYNDAKCSSLHYYICEKPASREIHEEQQIGIQYCTSSLSFDSCMATKIGEGIADCNIVESTISSGDPALLSATIVMSNPSATIVTGNTLTSDHERCYAGLNNAASACGITCDPIVLPSTVTDCFDGIQNGQETGIDCGGNDCAACANTGGGGDPHFVVELDAGAKLCYDVHGAPGDFLKLIADGDLFVNTLVTAAPLSVGGTYHGAIGLSSGGDLLSVVADGTVIYNGRALFGLSTESVPLKGRELWGSFVPGEKVTINHRRSGAKFEISFIAEVHDRPHLDFVIANKGSLAASNGTTGIIGQFMGVAAAVEPVNATSSKLTLPSGTCVDVATRRLPGFVGAAGGTCYKYFDSNAAGLLAGSISNYYTDGIHSAEFTGKRDDVTDELAKREKSNAASAAEAMADTVAKLRGAGAEPVPMSELRNTLIVEMARRAGAQAEDLQAFSSEELVRRASSMEL